MSNTVLEQMDIDPADLDNQLFIPSYPLDPFLWLDSRKLDQLTDEIAGEIDRVKPPGKKRSKDAQEKFLFSIKVLLLNLARLSRLSKKIWLGVSLRPAAYTQDRYGHPLLSFRIFKTAVYDAMLDLELIEVAKKGWYSQAKGKGETTRIEAAPALLERLKAVLPQEIIIFQRHPMEETIKLREAKEDGRKMIDYTDTDYTNTARDRLRRINACLQRHWYDLDMSEIQFRDLAERLIQRHDVDPTEHPAVDFSARSLYRIFNNGSFDEGGRFYGGWWMGIPSEYRRYLTINQKRTVEVDFSNLHPKMMYAQKGLSLEGDAYAVDGIERALVKKAFAQLINGKKQVRPPTGYDPKEMGMTWKEVLAQVEKRHAPISEFFRTGYGLKLQRVDADIAERVLLYFAERNIPCLPIHDSFIVHHDLQDELKDRMLLEYREELGFDPGFKVDDNYLFYVEHNPGSGEVNMQSIEDILAAESQSQYERRWRCWLEQCTRG